MSSRDKLSPLEANAVLAERMVKGSKGAVNTSQARDMITKARERGDRIRENKNR